MIEVENINFKLYKDNIITCIINIRNKDISNQLVIDCKTDFNDFKYSLILNFPKDKFLNFSSSNEAINFFLKSIYKGKIFVKEINSSAITIWVYTDDDDYDILDKFTFDNIYILVMYNTNNIFSNSLINNNINIKFYTPIRKKNEYVLWKDPNINKFSLYSYLQNFKIICNEKANMNIFFEISMEKALKFLLKNRNDKVILISNIGLDLSGKRFIEIARKILGFNIIVLFYSNNMNHLKWITKFPNCLFGKTINIFEEYITNYNKDGLKNLKKNRERKYNISLTFTDDFLLYPYYEKEENFVSDNNDINQYIRHVNIYNEKNNLYICMNKDKKIIGNEEGSQWDVTILDNEITLFSNGYYLDIDNNGNIIGSPYMVIWNFIKDGDYYYFINSKSDKNKFLSIENGELKVNKNIPGDNEKFKLIDIQDLDESFLSENSQSNKYIFDMNKDNVINNNVNNNNTSIK